MLRLSRPLALCAFGVVMALVGVAQAAEHTKDSVETIRKRLADKSAALLDVRETSEWNAGHLSDANLVPLSELENGEGLDALAAKLRERWPKGTIVYCHCAAGRRALTAGDILTKLGYDARPLKQGYGELLKLGFSPAKKEDGE